MRRATYTQGYARNKYQAAFPELWEGLVEHWDPSLGPTGLTLFGLKSTNGILTNMVAADAWVVGERGYALDYNGSSNFVDCGNSLSLNTGSVLSIAAWFRLNVITDAGFIVQKMNDDFDDGWALQHTGQDLLFYQNSSGTVLLTSSNIIANTGWYHVVVVIDGASNNRLYVNGNLEDTDTIKVNIDSIANLQIGAKAQGSFSNFTDGQIGPASVYNVALPESRIQLMAAGATPAMMADDVVVKAAVGISIPLLMQQMDQYSGGAML